MAWCGGWKKIWTVGCALLVAAISVPAQTSATPATPPTAQTSTGSSSPSASGTSAHKKSRNKKRAKKTANWRKHGQQKIDAQRTREIQDALIREHYLEGESSGLWDEATEKAMQHYQAANGWQSKSTPDARALIKLGLGPDQGHLLNPESAMTSSTSRPAIQPPTPKALEVPATATAPAAPPASAPADPPAATPPK